MPTVSVINELEIRSTLAVLSETARQIAWLARDHDDQQLHRKPTPEAWSAREIVAHLRACAEVWGASIDHMLKEDHPTIRYVSPRGWIKKTNDLEQGFHDLLREFSEKRDDLVETLRALDPANWARGATFTGTTSGRTGTVLSYAKRIADHEVQHLDQLRRTLGR